MIQDHGHVLHQALGVAALFVGSFQFVMRWAWAANLRHLDGLAVRSWAFSTMITALTVATVMFRYPDAPVDWWFLLVVGIVVAKAGAAVVSLVALRAWWHDALDPVTGETKDESHPPQIS